MISARTKRGTAVWVHAIPDLEPNENGYYCEIYLNPNGDRYDDFCIHKGDCDLTNDIDVREFIKEYVSQIIEY